MDVYPNPAVSGQWIKIRAEESVLGIEIISIDGTNLKKIDNININRANIRLDSPPAGVYCLQVRFQNGDVATGKIIKK